ncbi:carboxylating nicotinate-nucleotide diphosphorylase [Phaeovibrio sulfidiphilus]|uniref:nicotinate-nucleotide diphosphorylase (carboxylating) n=1 Tax=Phaeovibrio sulfidiphilus TaxID=1220600 RepID=A0A8J6YPS3_9PROT|nr:carboxylating nicotinate-nucleotide diphosphorylase [Phaeovibrio sulfidiphilus]MBE1237012.1 carboxylating nicotinate-nucleotide diphosphorylase [Phaeovibrio sulfidiphilus]
MTAALFDTFFQGHARDCLIRAIRLALDEDGTDRTTNAVFRPDDTMNATILAKEDTLVAGLPLVPLILEETARLEPGEWGARALVDEGNRVAKGTVIMTLTGSARILLRAERIILNFLSRLSGVANLTRRYVDRLEGTGIRLLDTRKTMPGLRYTDKYAVRMGGGTNHRMSLSDYLMLKDNHIDAAGGLRQAVEKVRAPYDPPLPVEVECRTLEDVAEAVACRVDRIMLDNMTRELAVRALNMIPQEIEIEISGGVSLEDISALDYTGAVRTPDFVSVGKLTHSAVAADFSMLFAAE